MKTRSRRKTRVIHAILIASALAAAAASGSVTAGPVVADPESVAQAKWRDLMARNPAPADGCFYAAYPSVVWQRTDCKIGQPRVHPTPVKRTVD
jgi:hypothetical protein